MSICLFLSLLLLALPISGSQNGAVVSTELWCVANNNAEDAALQSALDWACGPGAADCRPIQQGGPCYDPNDIQRTASFAFNDYYLKHGLTDDACNFDSTASLTSLNPSHGSCKFPSSSMVNNGSISGSTTTTTTSAGIGSETSDSSGCDLIAGLWFWPLLFVHLSIIITRII
ncbi:X8 domain-containing protein [Cephalotus follicularis]|uniref:X8 domain-containing protein n=1 Tax=Cephalotus follicularis TaxID=3775 RepID=A0A1Q3C728_CEPFO|nr:X8 domain-containing protein [Cephalotus follicularis]